MQVHTHAHAHSLTHPSADNKYLSIEIIVLDSVLPSVLQIRKGEGFFFKSNNEENV